MRTGSMCRLAIPACLLWANQGIVHQRPRIDKGAWADGLGGHGPQRARIFRSFVRMNRFLVASMALGCAAWAGRMTASLSATAGNRNSAAAQADVDISRKRGGGKTTLTALISESQNGRGPLDRHGAAPDRRARTHARRLRRPGPHHQPLPQRADHRGRDRFALRQQRDPDWQRVHRPVHALRVVHSAVARDQKRNDLSLTTGLSVKIGP